jgi:hypothetical protein
MDLVAELVSAIERVPAGRDEAGEGTAERHKVSASLRADDKDAQRRDNTRRN